jgi:hypothetical protein
LKSTAKFNVKTKCPITYGTRFITKILIFILVALPARCVAANETATSGKGAGIAFFTADKTLAHEIAGQGWGHVVSAEWADLQIRSLATAKYVRKMNWYVCLALPIGYLPISFHISVAYQVKCLVSWRGDTREFEATRSAGGYVLGAAPDPHRGIIDLYFNPFFRQARHDASRDMAKRIYEWGRNLEMQ